MQSESEHLSPIGRYRLAAGDACEAAGLKAEALEANVVADLLAACEELLIATNDVAVDIRNSDPVLGFEIEPLEAAANLGQAVIAKAKRGT